VSVASLRPDQIQGHIARLRRIVREECDDLHVKYAAVRLLGALLPFNGGTRLRSVLLRGAGFDIGAGVVFADLPTIVGPSPFYARLHIGDGAYINVECLFDLGQDIRIGRNVAFGHRVSVITSSHKHGWSGRRAGEIVAAPVVIGDGAWIGAGALLLPGVTIGAGAVIAAGAVVACDVAPNSLVGGVPAATIREAI
jgi:acetyltransferase-like isoleucine patch superfamily enzyme